ncbi:MAG: hypothetical protein ACI9HK_005522 [Pirellulaceae bacterium]|jgi:hypothetical protein
MSTRLHHTMKVTVGKDGLTGRRDFLKAVGVSGAAVAGMGWMDQVTAAAPALRERGMACILLWMQGGPSQFETFSPKTGHANGGETEAISTSVSGIQISNNLPNTASVMDDICLVRSMTSKEGSHPRASYLLHTGHIPTASVKYPTLGSIAAHQIGNDEFDLPSFVRIGRARGAGGAGFLGVEYDPFQMQTATRQPENTELPSTEQRYHRRLGLLGKLEGQFEKNGGQQEVADHRKLYDKAAKIVLSPQMNAFDIRQESAAMRKAYGESEFGAGCMLARRLVETGATFVEVAAGNWDTHQDNFDKCKDLCQQVDQPYAQLLKDLKQRGMLDRTLVIWMGEFGRTPRINARGGRDHYPRAFNLALAGGGVRGGQVIGKTDAGGVSVTDRPIEVTDLFRTICHSLKIDADETNMSSIGRPIPLVEGGETVSEVFG